MVTNKSLIINISQIFRHHSFGYEPQNLNHLDNQAFILTFCEHS